MKQWQVWQYLSDLNLKGVLCCQLFISTSIPSRFAWRDMEFDGKSGMPRNAKLGNYPALAFAWSYLDFFFFLVNQTKFFLSYMLTCAKKVWCWWHFKLIVTFKGNRLPNYIQTNEFASHWLRLSSKVNFPNMFVLYLSGDCGTCVFLSVWNVYCQLEKWKRWGACDIHWFEF